MLPQASRMLVEVVLLGIWTVAPHAPAMAPSPPCPRPQPSHQGQPGQQGQQGQQRPQGEPRAAPPASQQPTARPRIGPNGWPILPESMQGLDFDAAATAAGLLPSPTPQPSTMPLAPTTSMPGWPQAIGTTPLPQVPPAPGAASAAGGAAATILFPELPSPMPSSLLAPSPGSPSPGSPSLGSPSLGSPAAAAHGTRTIERTQEAPGPTAMQGADGALGGREQTTRPPGPGPAPAHVPLESPLLDLFRVVGRPADLRELGSVVVRARVHVRDHRGAELATRELFHEADLTVADRDRLVLPDDRIYGRDGAAVFAQFHRLAWPSLEQEAREELELLGLLLRLPWVFADPERWTLLPPEHVLVSGRRWLRVRVESRVGDGAAIGPLPEPEPADRFELWCEPASMQLAEVRYRLAGSSAVRIVRLSEWRQVGAVRMPARRTLLGADGVPRLEIELLSIDVRQPLPSTHFRPPMR